MPLYTASLRHFHPPHGHRFLYLRRFLEGCWGLGEGWGWGWGRGLRHFMEAVGSCVWDMEGEGERRYRGSWH